MDHEYFLKLVEKNLDLVKELRLTKIDLQAHKKITEAMTRNNMILMEMVNIAGDVLQEMRKITSTYHPIIIRGEAEPKDVKTCSNIVQKVIKYTKEWAKLEYYYRTVDRQESTIPEIDIMKFANIEEDNDGTNSST